jgi:hypothetical protein
MSNVPPPVSWFRNRCLHPHHIADLQLEKGDQNTNYRRAFTQKLTFFFASYKFIEGLMWVVLATKTKMGDIEKGAASGTWKGRKGREGK